MSSCYTSWKTSKTGHEVPCYADGKPSASLYNPKREAEQFANTVSEGMTVIAGFTSGLHIDEIQKIYPNNKIILVEKNEQTISFLMKSSVVKIPKNIIMSTVDSVEEVLIQNYFPPLDGNFSFYPVRSWSDENNDIIEVLTKKIKCALDIISHDISVQSHFGKQWQRNIFQNLHICENLRDSKLVDIVNTKFPTQKTALVIGAGPSLDTDIKKIIKERNKFFIIATDTAFTSLSKHNVVSDAVISIDAQHMSHSHFLGDKNKSTLFVFDLCANSVAVKKIVEKGLDICFFKGEHPLCKYVETWYASTEGGAFFPTISSAGGTVTVAALHFASLTGFKNIETIGCDFAFTNRKVYAKGIYMDDIFGAISNKFKTVQNHFSSIMFRTELIEMGGIKSTAILQKYRESFDSFFNNFSGCQKNNNRDLLISYYSKIFPSSKFKKHYYNEIRLCAEKSAQDTHTPLFFSLLPYFAWYFHKNPNEGKKNNFYKIALNTTIHF